MDGRLFVLLLLSGLFWSNYSLYGEYHYINLRMSWPEAQSYCKVKYTDLATVDSMDDVNKLLNIVDAGNRGAVWIGLKRGTQKRWAWSNGEYAQYYNWDSGEPNENVLCAGSYEGKWHDMSCSYNKYFSCYTGNNGYVMVHSIKNWRDAQSYCRKNYIDLPTIHNSAENKQHWAADQPSQISGSDCVGMSRSNSGRWAHYSCDLQNPFICYGGHKSPKYQFMNESMTWQDAQSYCRARFTDLATADSMSDVSLLVNALDAGYRGSVWIGLHSGTESRWIWSVGALSQYRIWNAGEPNGDGECVRSFNGSWYDESCSSALPFVCFDESTGFIIIGTALTWRDAQSYCRQHHIDLATIISAEQQNMISDQSSLWIGLFWDSWEWSDKWSLFFRHWEAGQPSKISGSGDCVGMSTTNSGKWAQHTCDLKQPFICHGDDILIKRQIVRLKLSCNGKCTLNDPSLQTSLHPILNEISEKLKNMGLESDVKINWRKREGEEVFHQEIVRTASSSNNCNKK